MDAGPWDDEADLQCSLPRHLPGELPVRYNLLPAHLKALTDSMLTHLSLSSQGSCMSSPEGGKKMKRTDTKGSGANELQRTTSSYQGSVADGMRYSDRLADRAGERERLTASQLHKSTTLEARIKQAEAQNKARTG